MMKRFGLSLISIATTVGILAMVAVAAGAEPLKGKVEVEDAEGVPLEAGTATLESKPLSGGIGEQLQRLRGQLDELKQLRARLEAAPQRTGEMQFSAKVDAVGPELRPNKLFAEANLPQQETEDGWYKIPAWRAGKFHREKQTDHTLFGDVTIASRVDHVYGMQMDKNGGIWHHESWPRVTKVELDGYTEYKLIQKYEPVRISPNEFTVKLFSTDIDVDNKTGKIKRTTKQEEFDRYFPRGNDLAVGECEWQGYSMNGGPNTTVEQTSVEEVRIEPFRVINKWKGKDLRASFRRYLQSHGMADLVPDDPTAMNESESN